MNNTRDYWEECIAVAADECDLTLTPEQLRYLADAAESGHEHYGMAFYSPPASDRIGEIEREWREKLKVLQSEHDRYVHNSEMAIKQALRVHRDDAISIGEDGGVYRNDGHITRIQ